MMIGDTEHTSLRMWQKRNFKTSGYSLINKAWSGIWNMLSKALGHSFSVHMEH
jgi:hypothetical protein